jgi:hypothetical protein
MIAPISDMTLIVVPLTPASDDADRAPGTAIMMMKGSSQTGTAPPARRRRGSPDEPKAEHWNEFSITSFCRAGRFCGRGQFLLHLRDRGLDLGGGRAKVAPSTLAATSMTRWIV